MNNESFIWQDADGGFYPFAANGITELWGMKGAHGGAHRISSRPIGGQPGSLLELVDDDVRAFSLPVAFTAPAGESGFRDFINDWSYRLDPTRGEGILIHSRGDGTDRYLHCICVGGFDFAETEEARAPGDIETVLEFEAHTIPYWTGQFRTQAWPVGGGTPGVWFGPSKGILPINLNASTVQGDSTITLISHKPVYPRWTVTGPGTTVTFTNTTTGRTIEWDFATYSANGGSETFDAGDTLVIDADRSVDGGTVLLNGTNAFEGLTAWDFWPFNPGTNQLSLLVTDSDTTTHASALWIPYFLGP